MSAEERAQGGAERPERKRARGIVAMGRIQRDADGFTVYSTGTPADAFRVWDDPHAGRRCTCDAFARAFRDGDDYECEHLLAVELLGSLPEDDSGPGSSAPDPAPSRDVLRRVM